MLDDVGQRLVRHEVNLGGAELLGELDEGVVVGAEDGDGARAGQEALAVGLRRSSGGDGVSVSTSSRSGRSEKRAASRCEQTRVDKGDPRVVASGATSIGAAMRRCRVHARGDIGVDPATPRVRRADRAARRVYRSASSSRENRWAIDRVNKCAIVGIGVRGVVSAGRCIGVSVDSPWRWRRRRDRSWRS